MDSSEKKEVEIPIKYVKSSNYIETYATGIWGGINQDGKVQMSFFEDMLEVPVSSVLKVEKDNEKLRLKSEKIKDASPKKIRNVKCTITFDKEKLEAFVAWMEDRIRQTSSSK